MNFKTTLIASVFVLSACGAKVSTDSGNGINVENNQSSSTYTYSYEFNGCKTGEHSFASASDYCNGLRNEQLNHGCAKQMREDAYDKNCR